MYKNLSCSSGRYCRSSYVRIWTIIKTSGSKMGKKDCYMNLSFMI